MKVIRASIIYCLVTAGGIAGCHSLSPSPKQPGKPPAPVHYESADEGLPTSRIWKSQMALGDINGDGYPDIGVVSRLADGPWIFKNDGNGHWTDASAALP